MLPQCEVSTSSLAPDFSFGYDYFFLELKKNADKGRCGVGKHFSFDLHPPHSILTLLEAHELF